MYGAEEEEKRHFSGNCCGAEAGGRSGRGDAS